MSATAFLSSGAAIGAATRPTSSVRSTEHFLDRPDGRIAYTDVGTGPLVVMVPGLGDVKEEYRFLATKVVAAGYRVVAMDIRGHGKSSVGWAHYTSSAIGSDIVALVRDLDAGPAVIVGTSMGAGAAAWAAAEAPDAVSGLVLIGPFVRELPANALQQLLIKVAFVGPWANWAWGAYYTSLYPTAKPADFAAYKTALLANLAEPGRMAALRAMMNASKADVGARLADVKARTLVVMGSKDPDFPEAAVEAEIIAKLLHGSVAMIEGAGHYPHAEMPEATAPHILAFLAGKATG